MPCVVCLLTQPAGVLLSRTKIQFIFQSRAVSFGFMIFFCPQPLLLNSLCTSISGPVREFLPVSPPLSPPASGCNNRSPYLPPGHISMRRPAFIPIHSCGTFLPAYSFSPSSALLLPPARSAAGQSRDILPVSEVLPSHWQFRH